MKTKLFLFLTFFSFFVNAQVSQQERQALIDFYNATDGDNWTNNTNWDTDPNSTSDVSTWFGVTTVNSNGQEYVARLFLNSNNLVGNLPDFKNLTKLLRLEIANNTISGEIDINKLPLTLNVLQLSSNQITGSIPDLTSFTNLLHIQLTRNKFVGNVSEKLFPSSIQTISIGYNDISGTLDFSSFPDLRTIIPAESNISFLKFPSNGIISSVFNSTTSFSVKNMPNLAFIEVPNVSVFTNLREDYFDLGLRIVDYDQADQTATPNANEREALKKLYDNKSYTYASTIKSGINDTEWLEIEVINGETRVTEIHTTNLAVNGEMPTEIGVFTELTHLHIPSSGINTIATELKNVTKLEELYLNNNSITEIPSDFYDLVKLRILNLNNNQIHSIANGLGNFIDLEELYFSNTQVDVIPTTIGNLKKLQILEFANTRITLLPPEIGGLIELTRLVAAPNNIASIPSEFGQLTKLQFLDFANCELSNTPAAFANLTELQTLFLNDNELQVVAGLGGFTKLKFLRLHNNRLGEDNPNFNTDLPEDLGDLIDLEELTLYNNQLTKLPNSIGNLNKLTELRLENNDLTTLPSSIGNLSSLEHLLLRNNAIETLPSSIGNLSNLKVLDLYTNRLTGLPDEIGNLSNLEGLFLTRQGFTENNIFTYTLTSLPATVNNLTSLKGLAASDNKITGDIDVSAITTFSSVSTILGHSISGLELQSNLITGLKIGFAPTFSVNVTRNPNLSCIEVPTDQVTAWENTSQLQTDNGVAISDNCTGFRIPQNERQALIDFYLATGGGENTADENTTWTGEFWDTDPNSLSNVGAWRGVTTAIVDGQKHVTELYLIGSGITGNIPESFGDLKELIKIEFNRIRIGSANITGLPTSIGELDKLEYLDLANNNLTSLPEEFGGMEKVTFINLERNQLESITTGIGDFTSLENLNLSNQQNPQTGAKMLTTLPNEIGNIATLKFLYLNDNGLTALPDGIGNLNSLEQLVILNNNDLTTLPSSIGNLSSLEHLLLRNNAIETLPSSIGNLSNLKVLDLYTNRLTGLPDEIGNLSNLEGLFLTRQGFTENNIFTYTLTSLPATVNNLTSLKGLAASDNKITGDIDVSAITTFSSVSTILGHSISGLELQSNLITGLKIGFAPTFSVNVTRNPNLSCIEVPTDQVTAWENTSQLQTDNGVAISDNCTGFRIPQNERQALIDFYLATGGGENTADENTTWTGEFWDTDPNSLSNVGAWRGVTTAIVDGQKHVTELYLIGSGITGNIPESFGDLKELIKIEFNRIRIGSANITGLPTSIGELDKLEYLDLANNNLTSLPEEFGGMEKVTFINLERNQLESITTGIGDFTSLENLNLSNQQNPQTGAKMLTTLPNEIGNIATLKFLYLNDNGLTALPDGIGNLNSLEQLVILNNNDLTTLPSSIGNLSSLEHLLLRNNAIETLPSSIGNLSNLKVLDLYTNRLTGLPDEIGNLSNLEGLFLTRQGFTENNIFTYTLTSLPATVNNLTSLKGLAASDNKITGDIDVSAITTFSSVSTILGHSISGLELQSNLITGLKIGFAPTFSVNVTRNPNLSCIEVPTDQVTAWENTSQLQTDNGVAISDNCTGFRIPQNERQALIDFYLATGGGENTADENTTWTGEFWDTDPNSLSNVGAWRGVTTAIVDGQKHVTELYLIGSGITGNIPESFGDLKELIKIEFNRIRIGSANITGLPASIGELDKLEYLDLANNNLTSLPEEFGGMEKVTFINLERNQLESITTGIGDFTSLENLNLSNQQNPQTGAKVLTTLPNEIGNIATLKFLYLNDNGLTALPSSIGNLINLEQLLIKRNVLESLPITINNLTNIETLELDYNENLSGSIDISALTALSRLQLQYNNIVNLKIGVSPTIFGANSVTNFTAKRNALGCIEVPTDELVAWQLSEANDANNKIDNGVVYSDNCATVTNNSIPDTERGALIAIYNNTKGDGWRNDLSGSYNGVTWVNDATQKRNVGAWFGVTTAIINGQKHVTKVELNSNLLDGTIPSVIKNLTQLKELEFNSNAISEIPSEIGELANLEQLTFTNQYNSENQEYVLKSIPTEINNIVSLKRLELSSNQLEGNLDFSNLVNLDNLSVSSNQITGLRIGTSPSVFDNGYDSERQYRRSFDFSNQYLNCVAVPQNTVADWEASSFATSAPSIVWGQDCTLYNNVPEKEIQALVDLYNNLDGANWVNKTNWDGNLARAMINNPFNATKWQGITTKIVNGEKHITDISLSSNGLKGELPESFGDLTKLVNLQLSSNEISGNLPASFGNLTSLKAIYLNSNSIEGLPAELGNLSTLETVYLQNNEIFGQLPDLTNNANLAQLFINGNKLQFGDFENEFNSYQNLQAFSYTNQAKVGEEQVIDFGEGYSTTFTAEVSGVNNTYQWYKNFSPITNETNKTLVINNANLQNAGSYYCKVSNTVITNLDIDTETITLNFDAALSTEDNSLINKVSLYPNPVSGILQIKISNDISIEEIEVFNAIGKKVRVFHKPKDKINLTSLSKGIYIINMITEKGKVTKRIVKK
ncbi:leucine-rich repeat domain-containing protein [Polaribacter sp. P097]|uniref:leucine-rich repeat domain-containing protein n=1 Tax=Polaribacter sp. P097 TaxID=3117398 RepID=UPI002FE11B0E